MAGWSGWAGDLLAVLNVPHTNPNVTFLQAWEAAEHTACDHNPLGAAKKWAGSSNCKNVIQTYKTQADGLNATRAQLEEAKFAPILDSLKSGDPYTYGESFAVADALTLWGAFSFSLSYSLQTAKATPGPHLNAPQATKGWEGIQRVVHHDMRKALQGSNRLVRAALRDVQRARRVKL